MTDDYATFGFVIREVSSQWRSHAECAKEIGCDVNSFNTFGRSGSIKIDGKRSPRGDAFKALTLRTKIEDVGGVKKGSIDAECRIAIGQPDDALCISVWQRPNQYGKYDAEDSSVGADTERKHERCHDNEASTS